MSVVLGPCPCQGCGLLVTWNGWEWQDAAHPRQHTCNPTSGRVLEHPFKYNERAGSSSETHRIAPAPFDSLTLLSGVAASGVKTDA